MTALASDSSVNRILLVEDDAGAQLLYRNRLTDLGYRVVVSSTGAMGLMEARSAPFDLFLVDIDLGSGIDGYEVCRRLKTIPEIHGVPVVLISGHVKTQEDLHRGYEAGCQSFLVKGDVTLLEDVVRAMLRIKSLQDDLALQNRLLEDRNRRFEAEKARSAELEQSLSANARGAREARRPDGMLLVDGEGVVRVSDRGARDLFGQAIEGKHLALLAPDSRLEAIVRNARTEPLERIRFEVAERASRGARTLSASVYPFTVQPGLDLPHLRLVLLFDLAVSGSVGWKGDLGAQLRREQAPLMEAAREVFRVSALLGTSPVMRELRDRVARAALSEGPALLQGPSGSGKGFLARILHYSGVRSGPFVELDCGELGPEDAELELFGDSDANGRIGALQRAAGGTLFLRDIERLEPRLQQRLLDAIVNERVLRQGASNAERVHVRVLASTRTGLSEAVDQGRFLLGLESRLTAEVFVLHGLKARREDLPALSAHFLAKYGRYPETRLTAEALAAFLRYDWPDNVRELELVIRHACGAARRGAIGPEDLPSPLADIHRGPRPAPPLPPAIAEPSGLERELDSLRASLDTTVSLLDAYEKGALLHALSLTQHDKLAAAKLLQIGKSTFYRKLKQHGIS